MRKTPLGWEKPPSRRNSSIRFSVNQIIVFGWRRKPALTAEDKSHLLVT
jgi:hypothetical protein